MSLLPFLIMNKQAENQKKSSYKKQENKEINNNKQVSVGEVKYTLEQYIYYLCKNDERVREFFKKLNEASIKIDKLDKEKYLESFVDISKKYFEIEEKIIAKLSELKSEGLSLSEDYRTKEHYYPVESSKGYGFCGLGIGYDKDKSFVSGFNGIRITEEMLLDEGKNPYEEKYREWESQNPNILLEEKKLEQMIVEKKKKLKFSLIKTNQKKEELANLEKQLTELKLKIEEGKQKREKATIFSNLTNSQKIKLLDYFRYVVECEKLGLKIKHIVNKVIELDKPSHLNNERNKWNRTIEIFLETKDFDANLEMEYVNNLIMDAFNKESFTQGIAPYSLNEISSCMAHVVDWYINKLSNENEKKLESNQKSSKTR